MSQLSEDVAACFKEHKALAEENKMLREALQKILVCAHQESYREPYQFIREIKQDAQKALKAMPRTKTK